MLGNDEEQKKSSRNIKQEKRSQVWTSEKKNGGKGSEKVI